MAEMFEIETGQAGRLWIMPCPDGTQLQQDIATYRDAGVKRVISMLTVQEATELGLAEEAAVCVRSGITLERHPIPDFGLPNISTFKMLVRRIASQLKAGRAVAVHCRAGIGRSGMVTAGVLIVLGQTADQAIQHVSQARGNSIPDTVEQGTFLATFADRCAA